MSKVVIISQEVSFLVGRDFFSVIFEMDSIDKFLIYDIIIMKTNSIFESWEKPGIFIWLFYFKFVIIFYRLPRAEIYYLEDYYVQSNRDSPFCDYLKNTQLE